MPGQKQNFGFITDFAHHVGPWSLNHFETAKGTLAPSPIARVIGCGCAESRTSPAVGPCCSSKNRSSETFWVAYPGTKIYGVSVPKKSLWYSFWTHRYHERQFGGEDHWCPSSRSSSLLQWFDPMQWSILNYLFSAKYHIHFKAIVIEAVKSTYINQSLLSSTKRHMESNIEYLHSQDPPQFYPKCPTCAVQVSD